MRNQAVIKKALQRKAERNYFLEEENEKPGSKKEDNSEKHGRNYFLEE